MHLPCLAIPSNHISFNSHDSIYSPSIHQRIRERSKALQNNLQKRTPTKTPLPVPHVMSQTPLMPTHMQSFLHPTDSPPRKLYVTWMNKNKVDKWCKTMKREIVVSFLIKCYETPVYWREISNHQPLDSRCESLKTVCLEETPWRLFSLDHLAILLARFMLWSNGMKLTFELCRRHQRKRTFLDSLDSKKLHCSNLSCELLVFLPLSRSLGGISQHCLL